MAQQSGTWWGRLQGSLSSGKLPNGQTSSGCPSPTSPDSAKIASCGDAPLGGYLPQVQEVLPAYASQAAYSDLHAQELGSQEFQTEAVVPSSGLEHFEASHMGLAPNADGHDNSVIYNGSADLGITDDQVVIRTPPDCLDGNQALSYQGGADSVKRQWVAADPAVMQRECGGGGGGPNGHAAATDSSVQHRGAYPEELDGMQGYQYRTGYPEDVDVFEASPLPAQCGSETCSGAAAGSAWEEQRDARPAYEIFPQPAPQETWLPPPSDGILTMAPRRHHLNADHHNAGPSHASVSSESGTQMQRSLASAMDQLQRCQSTCAELRATKGGVPCAEVENWCASIASQLQLVGEGLSEKLEKIRRKSLAKDETIRRLHHRLQAAERANADSFPNVVNSPDRLSHKGSSPQEHSFLNDSPPAQGSQASPPLDAAEAYRQDGRHPQEQTTTPLTAASSVEHLATQHVRQEIGRTSPPQPQSHLSSASALSVSAATAHGVANQRGGRGSRGEHPNLLIADGLTAALLSVSSTPATPSHIPGSSSRSQRLSLGAEDAMSREAASRAISGVGPTSTRTRRSGASLADPPSQKSLAQAGAKAQSGDKAQQVHLRREVAHLRRRDTDLAGQLRVRDAQIEQLTSTMREMQIYQQRQIGLYKRQLLQASHDEMHQQIPAGAHSVTSAEARHGDVRPAETRHVERQTAERHAAAAAPPPSTESARSSRRQLVPSQAVSSPGLGPAPVPGVQISSQGVRGAASGAGLAGRAGGQATPRPSGEGERGRVAPSNSVTSTWPLRGQKDTRERSLGAKPRSPQGRTREVTGGFAPVSSSAGGGGSVHGGSLAGRASLGSHGSGSPAIESTATTTARRRTSPGTAMGRATSADERGGVARRRQHIQQQQEAESVSTSKSMRARDAQAVVAAAQRHRH